MAARSLTERVGILEQKVEGLQGLPARMDAVELQILQLRGEMNVEFSAIRAHLARHDERFESIDRRFDDLERRILEGDEETKRYMRVLHEEVIAKLALLQEGRGGRRKQ